METNEQGLTKEERLMFSILGIILIVAIGVLIIKAFSENERVLEETPITENSGQNNNINEDITGKSDSSLIEETTENNVSKKYNTSYTTSRNDSLLAAVTKNDNVSSSSTTKPKNEVEGTGSTNPSIYNAWDFKSNIVTKAYKGDKIIIDKHILLSNGTEAEAQVTVRKLIDDTYMIVDIKEGYIIATPGTYRYYYTYANVTKELVLTVYDYIDANGVSILNINDEIIDDSIKKEEVTSIKELLSNSTITVEKNKINITLKQTITSSNQIPFVVTMEGIEKITDLSSYTLGTLATTEKDICYQNIEDNQFILWINTDILKSNDIIININGTNYILSVNISITLDEDIENKDEEEDKTITEDTNKDDEKNPDEGPKPDEQIENNQTDYNDENTKEENIVIATIGENVAENTSQ